MNLFYRIVEKNVPTHLNLSERRRIVFVNVALLSAAAVAFVFVPLYLAFAIYHTIFSLMWMIIGGIIGYIFNTKGYYKTASYFGVFSLFFVVVSFTVFYGLQAGTTNLLISVPGVSILLFGLKDLKNIAIASLLTMVCGVALVTYAQSHPAIYPQAEAINALFYYSSLIALGVFITFLMVYFHFNSMQDEEYLQGLIEKEKELSSSLEAKASQLEQSNEMSNELLLQVKDNELKLNSVLESFDDIIVLIDKDYIIKNIWKSKRMKLHMPSEQMLNLPIYDVFKGDYLKDATFMIDLTFLLQKNHYMEVFEKGNMRWYGLKTNYLEYKGEGHITVLIRYIDKMKRSELFIKESSALAKLCGWEYIIDKDKLVFTEGAERLLGMRMGNLNSDLKLLFKQLKPADVQTLKKALWRLLRKEESFSISLHYESNKGQQRRIFQVTGEIERNGKMIKRYKGYIQDVTEKNEALNEINRLNKFYQNILDGMPIDIGVMNADLRIEYINPSAVKNPEMRKWIVGKTLEEYAEKKGLENAPFIEQRSYFQGLATKNKRQIEYEETISLDDKILYFNRGFLPLLNAKNEVENVIAYGHNITVLKEIQLELEKVTQEALNAAKSKENFLSMMSHEIRTPLNAVIGLAHILSLEIVDDNQAQLVATLNNSAQALLVLINDILDYNKIVSGHLQLNSDPIDFNKLLIKSKDMFAFQAESKQINFKTSSKCPEGILYVGDEGRLFQIVVNLLSNAMKFTPYKGEINFEIWCEPVNDRRCLVHIEVKDTGIGIAKENRDLIFNAFSQESEQISRKFGGTGLGLSICKQLILEMGGKIDFESEVGIGTRFFIELELPHYMPLKKEEQSPDTIQPYVTGDAKVLIVEDNKVNQIVVKKFLDKWDIESDIANNGSEAIEMLNKNVYHLILMDLHMPVMDGYEAATAIRSKDSAYRNLPIIALTADIMGDVKKKIFASGMSAFISKPFKPEELKEAIFLHLNKKS